MLFCRGRWGDVGIAPYEMARGMCIRAGRVVRPYKAEQEPCETGRRDAVPYRALPGCPLQAQVAGHAGHGAAADADGHGAVLFIQDAAYL